MGLLRRPRFIPVGQWHLDTLRWPRRSPKDRDDDCDLPIAWAACGSAMRRASWRFWMAVGSAYSVRATVFKWVISRRSMDEDQRFGLGVNLDWSSLTRDASTRSPLWMTNGCAESLESWKQPTEIYGSTRFLGFSISVRRKSPKL